MKLSDYGESYRLVVLLHGDTVLEEIYKTSPTKERLLSILQFLAHRYKAAISSPREFKYYLDLRHNREIVIMDGSQKDLVDADK